MYFGSVKFYKHLIYIAMIIISILAIVGLITIISLIIPDFAEAASIDKINYNNNDVNNNSNTEENSNNIDISNINDNIQNFNNKSDELIDDKPALFKLYPELVCEEPIITETTTKTAYLTFDDGPSPSTTYILDILKEYNVKATFFVVTGSNNSNLELLKQIADEGHAIGLHSHSHDYKIIYESLESFLEDLNTSYNIIYEYTNIKPTIIRFPGGSVNEINTEVYEDITSEVLKRNFRYYDWNVSFEDAQNNITSEEIYNYALTGIVRNNENDLIILIHDKANNTETLTALKKVIDVLESNGYNFDVLDNNVEPITFSYK